MADDTLHGMGGLHDHEIRGLINEVKQVIYALEARVTGLEKQVHPNGRPGLEERNKTYTDAEIAHVKANLMQALGNATQITDLKLDKLTIGQQQMRETGEQRHEENKGNFAKADKKQDDANKKQDWIIRTMLLILAGIVTNILVNALGHH